MTEADFRAHFDALDEASSPHALRTLAVLVGSILATVTAALTLVPWQQSVAASGQVIAFDPVKRRQFVEAPIDGRIARWAVVEGSRISEGDVVVEISDNDAALVDRMRTERAAADGVRLATQRKADALRQRIVGLEAARDTAVAAATAKVRMAEDKVTAAERALEVAEAAQLTAKLNIDRQTSLYERGLSSRRNLELAQLRHDQTTAASNKARADLSAARNGLLADVANRDAVQAESQAYVDSAGASLQEALSDGQKAVAELAKIDVRLARQATQVVRAPVDGVVLRVIARLGTEMVKAGDVLMEIVPESERNVVEVWVDGNDAPLVSRGRKARLQFEGWPALQFIGWPSIAVGTFGGEVLLVDATDNGLGEFRALVAPDPASEPWPESRYLRQGVRTNGWILLDRVSLGFELWRQFNGFPPTTTAPLPRPQSDKR